MDWKLGFMSGAPGRVRHVALRVGAREVPYMALGVGLLRWRYAARKEGGGFGGRGRCLQRWSLGGLACGRDFASCTPSGREASECDF